LENAASQNNVQKVPGCNGDNSEDLEGSKATETLQGNYPKGCSCSGCCQVPSGCPAFQEDETSSNSDPVSLEGIRQQNIVPTKRCIDCQDPGSHQKVNIFN